MATDTAPVTGSAFPSTDGTLERRRLLVFLGVSFAVSWATAGVIEIRAHTPAFP